MAYIERIIIYNLHTNWQCWKGVERPRFPDGYELYVLCCSTTTPSNTTLIVHFKEYLLFVVGFCLFEYNIKWKNKNWKISRQINDHDGWNST